MNYWDALGIGLSFFWSPLFVLMLSVLAIIIGGVIAMDFTEDLDTVRGRVWKVVVSWAVVVLLIIHTVSLFVYLATNNIAPLSWTPNG